MISNNNQMFKGHRIRNFNLFENFVESDLTNGSMKKIIQSTLQLRDGVSALVLLAMLILMPMGSAAASLVSINRLVVDSPPSIVNRAGIIDTVITNKTGYAYYLNDSATQSMAQGSLGFSSGTAATNNYGATTLYLFDQYGNVADQITTVNGQGQASLKLNIDGTSATSYRLPNSTPSNLNWVINSDRFKQGRVDIVISGTLANATVTGDYITNISGPEGMLTGMLRNDVPANVSGRFSGISVSGTGQITVSYAFHIDSYQIGLEQFYPQAGYPGMGFPPTPLSPPACPADTPIQCPDKTCATSQTSCNGGSTCPPDAPYVCPDGSCAASLNSCGP